LNSPLPLSHASLSLLPHPPLLCKFFKYTCKVKKRKSAHPFSLTLSSLTLHTSSSPQQPSSPTLILFNKTFTPHPFLLLGRKQQQHHPSHFLLFFIFVIQEKGPFMQDLSSSKSCSKYHMQWFYSLPQS
jgi:hypothetical protein